MSLVVSMATFTDCWSPDVAGHTHRHTVLTAIFQVNLG